MGGNVDVSGQTAGLCDRAPFDWNNIPGEVYCPLCEYNLRGITEPRCPECGYAFDWADVLDPRRRLRPYVFEHHPERNVLFRIGTEFLARTFLQMSDGSRQHIVLEIGEFPLHNGSDPVQTVFPVAGSRQTISPRGRRR